MANCIICGSSVDGRVCHLHEEDVVFEFRGKRPEELTPRRYYRGSVDGYADFGIFVDIGDSVTGLLHRSELDRRLESIELKPGETVYVQVQNIRDNGNVDLGWSIRQEESQFRGTLVDDPDADTELLLEEVDDGTDSDQRDDETPEKATDDGAADDDPETTETETAVADPPDQLEVPAVTVDSVAEYVGTNVQLTGQIVSARQTSGPTIFELRDETGTIECAAFEEAGVRAYPDAAEGDVVRLEGEVERRRGELQVETETLGVLAAEERKAVVDRLRDALVERAQPEEVELLADDAAVERVKDSIRDAATAIRRAVLEDRPIVVRHAATADGYLASVAIERATLPLIHSQHRSTDAEYHYFDRRPLERSVYGMDDATRDVTTMLSNRERHGETLPLFVFVAAGGTGESLDGFDLLGVYGAHRIVVDERAVDDEIEAAVDVLVGPAETDAPATTATALATAVATYVNEDVRDELAHLPAVSFWENTPEQYQTLAADAGYDDDELRQLREALALEAFYQSYEDKRELVADLLFDDGDEPLELAGHVSTQFRTRMDAEIETAEANLDRHELGGETVLVLDTEAYTHRFEFPATAILLDELFRRHREDCVALIGVDTDEAYVRAEGVDIRELVELAREDAPTTGLDARGARENRVEFLRGERETARDALLRALEQTLSAPSAT